MQIEQYSHEKIASTSSRVATGSAMIAMMIGLVAIGGAFPRFYTGFAFTTLHLFVFAAILLLPLRYALFVGIAMGVCSVVNASINGSSVGLIRLSTGDMAHLLVPRAILPYLYIIALKVSRRMDPQSAVFTCVMAGFLGTLLHTADAGKTWAPTSIDKSAFIGGSRWPLYLS